MASTKKDRIHTYNVHLSRFQIYAFKYVLNYVTSRFCIKRCYNRGYNILHHIPTRENAIFDKIILIDRNILYKTTFVD